MIRILIAGLLTLPALGMGQSLDSLYGLLPDRPELRGFDYAYRAALERVGEVGQLPDLEVSAGAFILPVETRLGPQRFRVGATQALPWPGTLAARREAARAAAAPLRLRTEVRLADYAYELGRQYAEVEAYVGRRQVLGKMLEQLAGVRELARRRLSATTGSLESILEVRLRENEIERRIARTQTEEAAAWVEIEALVNTGLPRNYVSPGPTLLLVPDSLAAEPRLRLLGERAVALRAQLALVDLEQRPGFGVGVDYVATGRRTDADPEGNGRDVILPRVAVRIPLSKNRFVARRSAEQFRLAALDEERAEIERDIRRELALARVNYREAAETLDYLTEQLELLDGLGELYRSQFASGRRPLSDLLLLENQRLDYALQAVDARRQQRRAALVTERYSF